MWLLCSELVNTLCMCYHQFVKPGQVNMLYMMFESCMRFSLSSQRRECLKQCGRWSTTTTTRGTTASGGTASTASSTSANPTTRAHSCGLTRSCLSDRTGLNDSVCTLQKHKVWCFLSFLVRFVPPCHSKSVHCIISFGFICHLHPFYRFRDVKKISCQIETSSCKLWWCCLFTDRCTSTSTVITSTNPPVCSRLCVCAVLYLCECTCACVFFSPQYL